MCGAEAGIPPLTFRPISTTSTRMRGIHHDARRALAAYGGFGASLRINGLRRSPAPRRIEDMHALEQ
jgi:hypothetical protein